MILPLGETAALGAALSWSVTAQVFGAAGLRIGSVAVNHVRLAAAVVALALLHVLLLGTLVPEDMSPRVLGLFVASGIVGLTIGDAAAFRALVVVGPGLTTLVFTTVPALAALFAFVFLGERIGPGAALGMLVTVAGVALAAWGKSRRAPKAARPEAAPAKGTRPLVMGLSLALLGAAGQAGGIVLAKPALADASPLSGTFVRIVAGTAVLHAVTSVAALGRRRLPDWVARARSDRRGIALSLVGAVTGPVVGVWIAQVATKHAHVAVAATLMSTTPLFVLVEEWLLGRGRPLAVEILGAATAIGGVALLIIA